MRHFKTYLRSMTSITNNATRAPIIIKIFGKSAIVNPGDPIFHFTIYKVSIMKPIVLTYEKQIVYALVQRYFISNHLDLAKTIYFALREDSKFS